MDLELSDRSSTIRNQNSWLKQFKQVVPQDCVLPPPLFKDYISKLPQPLEGISITSYADDSTLQGA